MTEYQIITKALVKAYPDKEKRADTECEIMDFGSIIPIIFSHSFLKAFFGEEKIETGWKTYSEEIVMLPAWLYHGQQMLAEEESAKYLEKFL